VQTLGPEENFLPDSSKQRLMKIIEGGWVNEDYMNALVKYRSPLYASKFGLPEREMAFDISDLDGDTLINALGRVNSHKERRFGVVFTRRNDGRIAMQIDEGDYQPGPVLNLNYAIEGKDTVLLLTATGEKTTTSRFHRQFRKFPEADEIQVNALEYYVNRQLFAGDWEIVFSADRKETGRIVSFNGEGQVKNFSFYKRFSITTEEGNRGTRPDEISFYNDSTGVKYAFTLNDIDHLQLYELHEARDGVELSRGKQVYILQRKPAIDAINK
jgi:hypothetical protein